jgi:hypothetical protein
MSYAGHVFDMIARLKYNKAIRREKKGYFKVAKEFRYNLSQQNLTYNACTEEELKSIRETIRNHYRKVFIKRLKVLVVIVFILVMVIYYALNSSKAP